MSSKINIEKAQDIAGKNERSYDTKTGNINSFFECFTSAMMMAEWKDEQAAKAFCECCATKECKNYESLGKCSDNDIFQSGYEKGIRENCTTEQIQALSVDYNYVAEWYQDSIDTSIPPVWTDKHIEELMEDFYLIPKQKGEK